MNSLKTLFIVAVLGAVAYGVYVSINRSPQTEEALDSAPAWPGAPQVQIPGPGAASPQFPPGGPVAEMAPRFSSGPLATSPPPIGTQANGGPAASPSGGGVGASGGVASPGAFPARGTAQTPVGHADHLGTSPNALPGTQVPTSDPSAGRSSQGGMDGEFDVFMQAIQAKLDEGHLAEALLALSSLYDNPNVPPEQAQVMTDLLDQLAGTVIYSRQHLLEAPYRVRPGDTLQQIAQSYNVPWQLLARINGVRDPDRLEPGQELKVVRGPFNALVELDKYELTLMLGGSYAGRFPVGVGRDHAHLEGSYTVQGKTPNPPYYSRDANFAANDPNNPLGRVWIDLGNHVGIHGTNDPQNLHRTAGRGSVCLGDQDIEDLFGILSVGSRVIIQR